MKIVETHIVPAIDEKIRLQDYAFSIFQNITTKSSLKKSIKKQLILIDNKIATTANWIEPGQKIDLLEEEVAHKSFNYSLEILFEDEYLAVIKKPGGIPTSGNYFRTIRNALAFNLKPSLEDDALQRPEPAHRLDKDTSGVLLCAKTKSSLIQLNKAFEKKEIQKTYYAIVQGSVTSNLKISEPIAKKPALTEVFPEGTYTINDQVFSLVQLKPHTGRTHQLRIHLSESGFPIVGDAIYNQTENGFFKEKKLFLFAAELQFQHPVTSEELAIKSPLPKRFRNIKYFSNNT